MSEPLLEHRQDRLLDVVGVLEDVGVPETQDAPAVRLQPSGAARIALALRVLSAVGLDDEAMLDAGEVRDEGTERMLAAELVADEAAVPETGPEPALGVGHGGAQLPRSLVRHGNEPSTAARTLPALPSPHPPMPARWVPPSPTSWARGSY